MDGLRRLVLRLVARYLRSAGWQPGRWRLASFGLREIRRAGASMGHATVRTRYGFAMTLDLRDWVDQHVFVTGDYEGMTSRTIAALLAPGECCIDIGANIGYFSLLMARQVGPQGSVWAFEPAPATRQRLLANLALNRAGRVIVREEALADADGIRTFWPGTKDHSGIAALRPLSAAATPYTVESRRLTTCLPTGVARSFPARDGKLRPTGLQLFRAARLHHVCHRLGRPAAYPRWRDDLPHLFNALFTTRARLPEDLPLKPCRD
jgi:FkbM family methyltransferase